MRDPLARFYTWDLIVERKTGTNGRGDAVLAAPETVKARIRMEAQTITTANGDEVTTVATASCSSTTTAIPVGSRVTLPAALAANPDGSPRTGLVAVAGLHQVPDQPRIPSYYQIRITGGA